VARDPRLQPDQRVPLLQGRAPHHEAAALRPHRQPRLGGGRAGAVRVTSHYAAAKAGVIGFTRHLALEVGADGITVNAVAPGTTATERVLKARTPEATQRVAEAIPVRRLGEPGEIAEAVVFLASDAAAFINGATLDVNGGQVMA